MGWGGLALEWFTGLTERNRPFHSPLSDHTLTRALRHLNTGVTGSGGTTRFLFIWR